MALRIGKHLVKTGDLWALDIPAADTKTRRPLDYPISKELCTRIDLYLERFRRRIPGADTHTGLWASNKRRPMSAIGIYNAVRRRTKKAFGFGGEPASLPACRRKLVVDPGPGQRQRRQRPIGSSSRSASPRNTTSWHSRVSRGVRSPAPSTQHESDLRVSSTFSATAEAPDFDSVIPRFEFLAPQPASPSPLRHRGRSHKNRAVPRGFAVARRISKRRGSASSG